MRSLHHRLRDIITPFQSVLRAASLEVQRRRGRAAAEVQCKRDGTPVPIDISSAPSSLIWAVFCVEDDTGTGKGFIFEIRSSVQVQCPETVSGQLFNVRVRIMTPAGFSPYLKGLHVFGSVKLPDPCKRLRIVESANFGWQNACTHSLNIVWDAPASNCKSLPRYIVHV